MESKTPVEEQVVFQEIDNLIKNDKDNNIEPEEPILITTFGVSMCSGDRDGAC